MNTTRAILKDVKDAVEGGDSAITRRRPVRDLLGFCAFLAAFYVAYRYGMSFSQASVFGAPLSGRPECRFSRQGPTHG